MSSFLWRQLNSDPSAKATGNRVFSRHLSTSELGFHWDGLFAGTADTLQHVILEAKTIEFRESIITRQRLSAAWIHLKRRFPILACSIRLWDDAEGADFILEEKSLQVVREGEVNIKLVSSAQQVDAFNEKLVNGPRELSANLLATLWIFPREDCPRHFHVVTHVAHAITDGLSNAVILRELFNILAGAQIEDPVLEDRLMMMLPMEALSPHHTLSVARKRWRYAIAATIWSIRQEKLKGGHTLPRKITLKTAYTPAKSCQTILSFSPEASSRILLGCKKSKLTFNHAFLILSQVAQAKIIHKLRGRNEIEDSDWSYRLQQPMHFTGPLNLRSYLHPKWVSAGGLMEAGTYCVDYSVTLPFMPRTAPVCGEAGVDFAGIMSRKRFMLRGRAAGRKMNEYMKHPLQYEFGMLFHREKVGSSKDVAYLWHEMQGAEFFSDALSNLPVEKENRLGASGTIFTNGGSSMGNLDLLLPSKYPLPSSEGKGRCHVETSLEATLSTNRLRCRPAELYLGAYMSGQQIHLFVFWDGNVYETDVVKSWLFEVKNAAEYYLGMAEEFKYLSENIVSRL